MGGTFFRSLGFDLGRLSLLFILLRRLTGQQFTRRQKYFQLIGRTLAQKYKAQRAGECGGWIQFPFVGQSRRA